jgi:saxitoxin biosynthesis operon SxtJ-like protein
MMIEHEEHDKIEPASDRSFGVIIAAVFAFVAILPLWRDHAPHWWALAAAIIFTVGALVVPSWLGPLNRTWLWIGLQLHKIVNPIILGLIFYLAVTPTGIIMRFLGRDFLRLKRDPSALSYWIIRDRNVDSQTSMRNQY